MLDPIATTMRTYPGAWWIAGGWAIDLYLGQQSRPHQDVDIAVLRREQQELRRHFAAWSIRKVVNGSLADWLPNEHLELPIHELHAQKNGEHLEFLVNEADGDAWLFRRNRQIALPLERVSRRSSSGIPFFCPEVVLLYKAKAPRPTDRADFGRTLPKLDAAAKRWLAAALEICHPGHEWLSPLKSQ